MRNAGEIPIQMVFDVNIKFFHRNTSEAYREDVAQVLVVSQAPNFSKYLGLPAFVGRNTRATFSYIEDKIRQRIGSWNKKLLSQAGKEVLLKSVAQAMPTFTMSVFLLPDSVCTAIERVMNRYWWRTGNERGIHWKTWDILCALKKFGDLDFKDLLAFSLAKLGKQVWRFLTKPDSLVGMMAKVYKASGVRRRIGNGEDTLIRGHPWLPDDSDPK
ncbi:PREDICTED: uncharacterized protein LOC109176843 [Ipomoea nil]|uniref:uncharacterized protein LOC109176843 n=1 Tax=Ipomoea nil TaxID=35883 RepID=UPI0009018DE0|nr:PREDICTED: uncharacterized protein LOC109176843 [Ipomoea nil]